MPSRAQAGGVEADKSVLRTLAVHANRHVGVYARVARSGAIRVGDPVELKPDSRPAVMKAAGRAGHAVKKAALGLVGRAMYGGPADG